MRAEEEKEEKRLAEQRARMQRGYDEEQRRQEKVKVTSRAEARAPLSHRTSGSVWSLWVLVYCASWPFFRK